MRRRTDHQDGHLVPPPLLTEGRATVAQIMNRDVVCIPEDSSVEAATAQFFARDLHGAPVVDGGGRIVGFLSLSDLWRRRSDGDENEEVDLRVPIRRGGSYALGTGFHLEEIASAMARDVMMPHAISVAPSTAILDASALMVREAIHRVPVVTADRKVVGIVSSLDILRWLSRYDDYRQPAQAALTRQA